MVSKDNDINERIIFFRVLNTKTILLSKKVL